MSEVVVHYFILVCTAEVHTRATTSRSAARLIATVIPARGKAPGVAKVAKVRKSA